METQHKESVRTAGLDDIEALNALVNSAYRGESSQKGWTSEADFLDGTRVNAEVLREMIESPTGVILLYHSHGELHACVNLQKRPTCGYLGLLTVRPDLQGSGTGKKLLQLAENWVVENWKLHRIEMTVIHLRKELLDWYKRRGYKETGRTEPFPKGDPRFGVPKVANLEMLVLEKMLQ